MKTPVKILFVTIAVFLLSIGRYFIFPEVATLKKHNPGKTSFMKFREREWAEKGRTTKAVSRWVPYEGISKTMVDAVVVAEDAKFWNHNGFDYEAIRSALKIDIQAGRFRIGASTISQQLAKNLFLGPSKNPVRKLDEAVLTWRLEKTLSKKRILELYLNVVEWGDGIFGVENASWYYYKKSALDLDANEASRLAAVLPNPLKYSPLSGRRYVVRRSALIYRIMNRRRSARNDEKPLTVPKDSLDFQKDSLQAGSSPPDTDRDSSTHAAVQDSAAPKAAALDTQSQ